MARPKLVADAGMDTHILFTRVGLDRLKQRISELVQENKAERNNFKASKMLDVGCVHPPASYSTAFSAGNI